MQPAKAADSEDDAEAEASLRRLGVAEAEIEQARAAAKEQAESAAQDEGEGGAGHLVVWAWHLDAVHLFIGLREQWRVVAVGHGGLLYLGLDYGALSAVQQNLGIAPDRETFEQLQHLARAARRVLNQA